MKLALKLIALAVVAASAHALDLRGGGEVLADVAQIDQKAAGFFPHNENTITAYSTNNPGDLDHLSSLPWTDLGQSLSDPSLLSISSIESFKEECVQIFEAENYPTGGCDTGLSLKNGSNYQLLDQPSGLCADTLACAFKRCDWYPTSELEMFGGDLDKVTGTSPGKFSMEEYVDFDAVPDDGWNLPYAVVHPETASDVIATIDFARSHGAGLSVKTSGHSWTGSSTEKDSILLNTRRLPKYASEFTDASLLECDTIEEGAGKSESATSIATQDLRNKACDVAVSRGLHAILRVGGGEIWDEVYRALSSYNEAKVGLDGKNLYNIVDGKRLYNVVGGSAGTVSATGGYMTATGLSGNSGTMRMAGFACDQVVQLEMVLPTEQHVRFGPTEWEESDAADWPQTTRVTGWCNDDPTLPEEEWEWHECTEEDGIPASFDDLWHAVRGGGGGYGVLTSVEYQLPDYPGPLTFVETKMPDNYTDLATAACGECTGANEVLQDVWANFIIDVYFNPSGVGMTDEDSALCGGNGNLPMIFGTTGSETCHAGGAQATIDAWQRTVSDTAVIQRFLDASITQDMIDMIANFLTLNPYAIRDYTRYALFVLPSVMPVGSGVPEGRIFDSPAPTMLRNPASDGLIVPISFLVDNRHVSVPWLTAYGHATDRGVTGGMYMMGAKAGRLHDGTTATGSHYREGAFYGYFAETLIDLRDQLYNYKYGDGAPDGDFQPFAEYNHAQNDFYGPMKTNWSTPCPRLSADFSTEQRNESCIPLTKFVFGTEGLARLERIKSAVDPDHLFNAIGTVGYREKGPVKPVGDIRPTRNAAPTRVLRGSQPLPLH